MAVLAPLFLAVAILSGCGAPDSHAQTPNVRAEAPCTPAAWPLPSATTGTDDEWIALGDELGKGTLVSVVASKSGTCFQVDGLRDDVGTMLVIAGDFGPVCTQCDQRVAAGVDAAVFMLPSSPLPAGRLLSAIHVARRDCATMGSPDAGIDASALSVKVRPMPEPLAKARLPVAVYYDIAGGADWATMEDHVNSVFSEVGIDLTWAKPCGFAASKIAVQFEPGDVSSLRNLLKEAAATCPVRAGAIPIVVSSCLTRNDAAIHGLSYPIGTTTHIPGDTEGQSWRDVVVIGGGQCLGGQQIVAPWSSSALARIVTHELGHFMGLFHSVESDGRTDAIDDTTADNIMYFDPLAVSAGAFSATQGWLMRRHPAMGACDH